MTPRSTHKFQNILSAALMAALLTAFPMVCAAPAAASSLNDFNLIALGDLNGSSNVEGRVVVFGDVYGNSKDLAKSSAAIEDPVDTPGLNQTDSLIVGGRVRGNSVQVEHGGVRTGGSATGSHINNADYVNYNDTAVADMLSSIQVDIDDTIAMLDSLTTNSYVDLSVSNRTAFDLTPGDDNIAVFDIDASLLNQNGTLDLTGDLEGVDLIVIRVSSADYLSINGGMNSGNEFLQDEYQSKIIWYFPDAEEANIARLLGGSVIIPNGDLTITAAQEGTVIAQNITMNAQVHLPSLDSPALDTPANPVPEPGTNMLLGLGLFLLLAFRRGLSLPRKLSGPMEKTVLMPQV